MRETKVTPIPRPALPFNDLLAYDPSHAVWTDLSVPAAGRPPIIRHIHGFTAAGGRLYVHGGGTVIAGRALRNRGSGWGKGSGGVNGVE